MTLGRPPLEITPERHKKIVDFVKLGNFPEIAAQASGISPRQYYRWMARGRLEPDGPYWQFWQAVKAAGAEAETSMVNIIVANAFENWHAAAWWLERKSWKRWGRKLPPEEREKLAKSVAEQFRESHRRVAAKKKP